MLIFSAARVLTQTGERRDWALAVKGDTIVGDGPRTEMLAQYPTVAFRDFGNAAIIPGFVNAHEHSFQSLIRGRGDDIGYYGWRDHVLFPLAKHLGPHEIEVGAMLTFGELLRNGVTTVADFFYPNNHANHNAHRVIRTAELLGIRLVLARGMYDWPAAPAYYREDVATAEKNTRSLIEDMADHPLVRVHPAPHSLHGASPQMIQRGAAIAREFKVPFHLHFLEEPEEREELAGTYHLSPLEYLDSLGVLGKGPWLAVHAVWIKSSEIAALKSSGAAVVHNPSSNLFLADGFAPTEEFLDHDMVVALGTDGACTNNRQSIVDEMRLASLLQKGLYRDASLVPADVAFAMGTRYGADALDVPAGLLGPGRKADFVVLNLDDLSMLPPGPLANQCVWSLSPSAIDYVYIGGRMVVDHGRVLSLPSSVASEMLAIAARLDEMGK